MKSFTEVIYPSGFFRGGPNGLTVIYGGAWRLYRQEGFPIDLTVITLQEQGALIDWCEAMAEAFLHTELPQLCKQVEVPATAKNKFATLIEYLTKKHNISTDDACHKIINDKRAELYPLYESGFFSKRTESKNKIETFTVTEPK